MPYTPYHFGPSGLVGIGLRRWIDIPVFILANIVVDSEVIFDRVFLPGGPVHQALHLHTLTLGVAVGAAFGAAMYYTPTLRRLCEWAMAYFGLHYRATAVKMILAGIFGVIFHVLIDSIHHEDVQPLWPFRMDNTVWNYVTAGYLKNAEQLREMVVGGCLLCWAGFAVWYGTLVDTFIIKKQRLMDVRKHRSQARSAFNL